MLLTHQTFVTFTKSQKYFCVHWQRFIQRSQTLLSFDLNILFFFGGGEGRNNQLSTQSGLKLET